MNLMRKALALALVLAMVLFSSVPPSYARTTLSSDTGHLGNDNWSIDADGNLLPNSNSYTIGDDTYYPASISLGGVEKTSWGSIVSPMTDADGYVYPTDSGAVYRMYDAGYLSLGGNTAVDCYVIFDGYVDAYIGIDDTDDSLHIGYGGTMGTTDMLTFPAARTFIVGDGTANDFGFYFDGNGADFSIGMDDTGGEEEDLFCISIGSAVATTPELSIGKGTGMVYVNAITSPGTTDLDIGESGVTDILLTTDGGAVTIDGTITLTDGEVISNATDDTIRIASGDLDTILEVYTAYDTTGDATLKLSADLGDEAGEQWTITSTGATTDLVIGCDDSSSGTPVTRLTISDAGVVTTMGTVNLVIDDASNSTVTDVLNVTHSTSGAAAAGIGTSLTFDLENDATTIEEHFSMDVVATSTADGAEDTDVVFNLMNAGALSEVARLDADAGFILTSAVTVVPAFNLVNTNADANSASINFKKDGEDEADDDVLGLVNFYGNDSGNADQIFGYLKFTSTDITAATEAGSLELSLEIADSDTSMFKMFGDAGAVSTGHIEFNMDTVDVDFHIDGDSVADIFKVDAGTDTISMALNAADSQFLITQTDTTGTTSVPFMYINDDRTGTNANTTGEATLMIDPQGTHAINIVDGITYSGGIIQSATDVKFRTDVFASGHYTGTTALASAVSGITDAYVAFGIVTKDVGATAAGYIGPGVVGQMLTIAVGTYTGAGWVLTPSTKTGFATITFDTALDTITLLWLDATRGWIIVGNAGCTIG